MSFLTLQDAAKDYANLALFYARRNLNLTGYGGKGRKINNSKDLSDGLSFKLEPFNGGFIVDFTTEEKYGVFVHWGVNGTKKKHGAPFSFKKPAANFGEIMKYVESPKVRLRKTFKNSNGQTVSKFVPKNEENKEQAAWAMAISIAKKGFKSKPFMKDGADEAMKKSVPEMEKALVYDIEEILISSLGSNPNIKITRK